MKGKKKMYDLKRDNNCGTHLPNWLERIVSRDGSRRRGGGNDTPPPVELTLSRSQKVTVRRECGSRRCSHLSDLGSPDIGRGKKKEAKWLAGGDPKRKWGSLPLSGSKYKKLVFGQVSWQTDDSHFTPG